MKKKLFKIPTSWVMEGNIEVEAGTLEEAMEIAKLNIEEYLLPDEPEYRDHSHVVDDNMELARFINK